MPVWQGIYYLERTAMIKIVGSKFVRSDHKEALLKERGIDDLMSKWLSEGYQLVNESDTRVIFGKPSQAVLWLEEENGRRYVVNFHDKIKEFYDKQALHLATFDSFMKSYYNGEIEILKESPGNYYIKKIERTKKAKK
jgi:hypothetical protein